MQRFENPNEEEWAHRILKGRIVKQVDTSSESGRLKLSIGHVDADGKISGIANHSTETMEVDALMVATGYRRDAHKDMLHKVEHLRPAGLDEWIVTRDYKVALDSEKVSKDSGVFLQGCNEKTHGLSDSLLSILATRGGEMVDFIFGDKVQKVRA